MKKIGFVAAFAALAFAGCQKEASFEAPQANDIVLTALSDNFPESKTVLDGVKVLWNTADCIAVFNGSAVAEFSTAAEDKSATADFTTSSAEFGAAERYLAVYPYSEGLDFADGKVTVTVPATQTATVGSFDPKANVAVASGAADVLQFRNVCAYLKFTVPAKMTDLTKVVLSANGSEKLAGNVKAACADASFEVVDGVSSVALEGTFEAGSSYYIAVLPGTLTQGFTITMTRSGKTSTMKSDKKFTFTRSHSANIGELYDGIWKVSLEGTAVPEGTLMTNCGNGYCSFRGNLSKGDLTMRVLYENINLGTVSIPSDGWYHILLDTATKNYQIYTQDVFVDFGNKGLTNVPWNNVKSISTATSDIPVVLQNPPISLNDYKADISGLMLNVDNGFLLYDAAVKVDSRGNYVFKDDSILMTTWYDGFRFSGANQNTDSEVKYITISGLDVEASYDLRILCIRRNATPSARITKLIINDNDDMSKQVYQGFKSDDYSTVVIGNYISEFNDVTPTSEGELKIGVQAIQTGKASEAHINAIQIFKKLNQ